MGMHILNSGVRLRGKIKNKNQLSKSERKPLIVLDCRIIFFSVFFFLRFVRLNSKPGSNMK